MPRTKQIHPRNLRDKIEEAQKELNEAEDSQKDILETGVKGTTDTVKGVKRKKIVTENHLKKIPKSPLRNPLQTKLKENTEQSFNVFHRTSEYQKEENHLPVENGKQFTKQNGETPVVTTKAETSVPPKKLSLSQHSLELRKWRSEGSDSGEFNLPDEQCVSSSMSSMTKTDNSECITFNCSTTSSSYTSTAFDVLLKAMEPELSTLSQKGPSCAIKIEKLRPNKAARSPSKLKNSQSTPNHSLSHQEFLPDSQVSPCTLQTVHVSVAGKDEQVSFQSVSPSHTIHEQFVSKSSQYNQQLSVCPGFTRSLTHQQSQDNPQIPHVYNMAVTSSVNHTPPSNVSQVIPQNQPVDSSSPMSVSPTNPTQLPIAPMYNSAQVTSIVNHSVEQMYSLILKDQKPKKQGKYICEYCSRACAKPSVLLKHIRSHTGERPYPCVTCGFSFKTKSNLYKHKKSHAHAIKLGLVLQPDSSGLFLSHESAKALNIHSDVEESGESDDEGTADERQDDQGSIELESTQIMKIISNSETLQKSSSIPSNPDHVLGDFSLQENSSESQGRTALPKVVVHPVNISPLRADSPKVIDSTLELPNTQKPRDIQVINTKSNLDNVSSLETDNKPHQKGDVSQSEERQESHVGPIHAQLQRQQATDCPQEQQGKHLLSPRSLGSTDSGYFSRSESTDQTMSPPSPFVRVLPTTEKDQTKNNGPYTVPVSTAPPSATQTASGEKALILSGQMRPPMATKTLEERISKLISDNEALVDDKQLDSVKPRRTSLSRRGSIDSPKSYIFKDSFQFDLKPMGRRTSSSSDIPKSPFTPTEKSKQVFLLSVPSLDCLPITRSNSMPTTGYSAVPANIIPPPHPLRGSQSFDDKIGSFYDDVFVSGPNSSVQQSGHPRTLVRQTAIEDSSSNENHVLGTAQSSDEGYLGCNVSNETLLPRSKSFAQGSNLEKKKSHQGRGTMFECETCRNRYRKLENFENHKKFYCSELHGPKTKVAIREAEHSPVSSSTQPPILHYRMAGPSGVWEQTPQIRKRRKMKSAGDDDDLQQNESGIASKSLEGIQCQNISGITSLSKHSVDISRKQSGCITLQKSQIQLVTRIAEQIIEPKLSPIVEKQINAVTQEKIELKRQGTGISVIQHTNSLSRPTSFEKSEPFERSSPVSFQELSRSMKHGPLKTVRIIQEDGCIPGSAVYHPQLVLSDSPRAEFQENPRVVSNERNLLIQSRLVRQRNIQVPEILVTEEPDRDHETQSNDQEKTEKFNWPQRSETLAKLPTEKLPPKKKRIRLAEMEHSSAESSFDSTLSRSLSRESSLSHTSSFSASLDIDEVSKIENTSKIESINKSELLMIPAGSQTLNVPGTPYREMRRAASEQINCTQPSMEVSDFRSKSFDCGNTSPSKSIPLVEVQTLKSPTGIGITGHVPLLERRRGPLVRQISLNIAPESHLPPVMPSSFPNTLVSDVTTMTFHRSQICSKSLNEFPSNSLLSQIQVKDLEPVISNSVSTTPQQLLGINLTNQIYLTPQHPNVQTSFEVTTQGKKSDAVSTTHLSSESEDCFAPKYQLHFKTLHSSQSCSNSINPLSNQVRPNLVSMDQSVTSLKIPSTSTSCPLPPLKSGHLCTQIQKTSPFVVPVHIHSNVPPYSLATVTSLPQILVTQDQSNQSVCKTNMVTVPTSESAIQMPKSHQDPQNALPNSQKQLVNKNVFSEIGQNSTLSESLIQKIPVSGLFPHPEASASSKRMLSPANSLDIAMEKQQKRAKDENGAVCITDIRSLQLLNVKISDSNKHKKPVLVRQVCTTDPLEGVLLDQEVIPQLAKSSDPGHLTDGLPASTSSGNLKSEIADHIKELPELGNIKSSISLNLASRKPPVSSPEHIQISPLKNANSNQERNSSVVKNKCNKMSIKELTSAFHSGDVQQLSFPSLKTTTSFTWCYLVKQKPLHLPQNDQKTSAYSLWNISSSNPNPLGLPTKIALSLLNSKQKFGKSLYSQAITSHSKSDVLVYSSKWKNNLSKRALGSQKSKVVEFSNKDTSEISNEQDKENSIMKNEPRRVKIFDGGYKSNEDYVYVRGRGRGKYICEECGIRCKKPSMLKKHIRTHTDVRPYHCNYCNFSFKTKGNLTKHMKSKAHSKKCVDLGVSVGVIDDQDPEESGEKQRFGYEQSGYEIEDSDGPDDDENEEDDEDSQGESVQSATPSITASPQHHPSRSGLQESLSADEESRMTECFSAVHSDPMDALPKALLTKMTVLSSVQSDTRSSRSPVITRQHSAKDETTQEKVTSGDVTQSPEPAPRSPCHQMSIDYPDAEEVAGSATIVKPTSVTQNICSLQLPSPAVDHGTQTTVVVPSVASPYPKMQEQRQQIPLQHLTELMPPQTHLFSHLPLHSQQQTRTPFSMIPVGGIHVVPAGLTAYSTFVPIQAGSMQFTIPAVGVIHRTTGPPGDLAIEASGTTNPTRVAELNSVMPCIPIGQIGVPGLQNLSAPSLQTLPPLSMETVNILGLANTNITPQVHPSGLALNAVGLQVLTASPSAQSNPSPQTHIPGLQILNIALPTLIPSVSPVTVDGQGVSETPASQNKACETQSEQTLAVDLNQIAAAVSPQGSPKAHRYNGKDSSGPTLAREHGKLDGIGKTDTETTDLVNHGTPKHEATSQQGRQSCSSEPLLRVQAEGAATLPGHGMCSPEKQAHRPPSIPHRQNMVQFSDVSSDDDEDRLVIAT
ncbi:zinc finger protein 40 isoform X1 [Vombatus ursinus]|uniref:Zinc finger protein 40 n=2 Tax=Vombatus ursinus TaxID=29139 RepID=A0A4X2JWR4_VOMUR|nr:zinc finger protein 40 isoform X1 [Vombatus ursinus]XP_027733053.1 zinc finger protein 40 isoform X1 [Vombatus ursinus]XP_027733131.1 zinc finger protein 40 isoform X1 [Vombatus ursinus]XP_027733195.1 zinc finger protein 40 isoform X1 [Vombatus ursinus]XP_027733267.1 zinc finger protein 40 isoform X1 [Vombatus ursinus]